MLSAAYEQATRMRLRDELGLLKEEDEALIRARGARDALVANVQVCTVAFEQARVALQMAKADLGLLDAQIGQLVARSDALRSSMTSARTLLQTLATFPLELLALIFEDACAVDVATQQDASVDVDWHAAKCPYAIAGVCRRWRDAALNTHAIWRYIAVPQQWVDAVDKEPFQRHMHDLLSRSGSRSLDVTISFGSKLEASECARHNAFFSTFFQPIYRYAPRIRSLRIQRNTPPIPLPSPSRSDILRSNLQQLLRCPTPQLEYLDIRLGPLGGEDDSTFWLGYPERDLPRFLPEAPVLRSMQIAGAPILLRRPISPHLSLTYLSFTHRSVPTAYLWDTLAAAPNLQYLKIHFGTVIDRDGETLARLTALPITTLVAGHNTFDHLCVPTQVEFPHLSALRIPHWSYALFVVTDALARSVTSIALQLYEEDMDDRTELIAKLRLLRAVEFADLEYLEVISEDEALLFDAFCDPVRPMWPKLRTLRLQGLEDYDDGDVERGGLLRLLQIRNVSRPSMAEGEAEPETMPVPIEALEFDARSVPPWLAIRVEAILGDKCKQIDYTLPFR
ncbi:hypothetical protein EXIGLDRAFT_160483 [Exidia glandulosa HHB12029]|uniref:F-box domain-containing protein n=1 Tax=Exidia glandulosa HHB12029 TaxID=1314781 RepID=A0A165FIA3_EXIGL|nr:hypothetical protein EXIGLDRAFT_160483 [Exidia glandulosa HHB12029]